MAKEKSKKVKPGGSKSTGKSKVTAGPPITQTDTGKNFDFGGLPDIDLKKNLGCG